MYVGVYMIISIPVGDTNLYPLMNVQRHKASNLSSEDESAILIGFMV